MLEKLRSGTYAQKALATFLTLATAGVGLASSASAQNPLRFRYRVPDAELTTEENISVDILNRTMGSHLEQIIDAGSAVDEVGEPLYEDRFGRKWVDGRFGKHQRRFWTGKRSKFGNGPRPLSKKSLQAEADAIVMADSGQLNRILGVDFYNARRNLSEKAETALEQGLNVIEGNVFQVIPVDEERIYAGVNLDDRTIRKTKGVIEAFDIDGNLIDRSPIRKGEYTLTFSEDPRIVERIRARPRGAKKWRWMSQEMFAPGFVEGPNVYHLLVAPRHPVFTERREGEFGRLQEPRFHQTNLTSLDYTSGKFVMGLAKPIPFKFRAFGDLRFVTWEERIDKLLGAIEEIYVGGTGYEIVDYRDRTDEQIHDRGIAMVEFNDFGSHEEIFEENFTTVSSHIESSKFGGFQDDLDTAGGLDYAEMTGVSYSIRDTYGYPTINDHPRGIQRWTDWDRAAIAVFKILPRGTLPTPCERELGLNTVIPCIPELEDYNRQNAFYEPKELKRDQ